MKNELSLVEGIQLQIVEERKNYRDALLSGKYEELKVIKQKIEHLENSINLLQHEYRILTQYDLSIEE
jgi:hypothetical protein